MIHVYLERNWTLLDSWNVFVVESRPGSQHLLRWESGAWQADPDVPEGKHEASTTKPSLVIPGEVLEALVKEANKALPADGSMAEHLKDTRQVRDRLLSLIEIKWGHR